MNNNAGSAGAVPPADITPYKCSSCGHSGTVSARCPHCGSLLYYRQ